MHYSINISVSKRLKAFVDETVKGDVYTSTSDFLRELLREAQRQQEEKAEIDRLLIEALDDPRPDEEVTPAYWRKVHKELNARLSKKKPTV